MLNQCVRSIRQHVFTFVLLLAFAPLEKMQVKKRQKEETTRGVETDLDDIRLLVAPAFCQIDCSKASLAELLWKPLGQVPRPDHAYAAFAEMEEHNECTQNLLGPVALEHHLACVADDKPAQRRQRAGA